MTEVGQSSHLKDVESNSSRFQFNPPLTYQRYAKVSQIIAADRSIRSVADFGCSEGKFIRFLKNIQNVEKIFMIDKDEYLVKEVSIHNVQTLPYDMIFGRPIELDINLYIGDATLPEPTLLGIEAISCIELVEHLKLDQVDNLVDNILGYYKPKIAVITTPNREFNIVFAMDRPFRHPDHKFEWTREEFKKWCSDAVTRHPNYSYELTGVGEAPSDFQGVGFCSQIAIFRTDTPTSQCLLDDPSKASSYHCVYQGKIPHRVANSIETQKNEDCDWGLE